MSQIAGILSLLPPCTETLDKKLTVGENGNAMLAMYTISMVFIVIANSLFIFGLFLTGTKRFTSVQRLFLILSCSDLFAGVVYIPIQIFSIARRPHITCKMTAARSFLSVFPIVFSGIIIMFITVDRYLIVARPETDKFGNKRIAVYVIGTLMLSVGWGVWYSYYSQQKASESSFQNTAAFFIALATFEVVVLVTALVFNILIVCSVKANTKNSTLNSSMKKSSEQKLSRTIVIISSALVITYLPSVIGLYITGTFFYDLTIIEILITRRNEIVNHSKILIWTLVPTLFNSGLNATIFIARNTKIKRLYASLYKRNMPNIDLSESVSGIDQEKLSKQGMNKSRLNIPQKVTTSPKKLVSINPDQNLMAAHCKEYDQVSVLYDKSSLNLKDSRSILELEMTSPTLNPPY